jgi:serine/threonine protein phosphatase PrpC
MRETTLVNAHAVSHAGCQRADNEDSVLCFTEQGLWAVADGLGGHRLGAQASEHITAGLAGLAFKPGDDMSQRLRQVTDALAVLSDQLEEKGAQLVTPGIVGSTVAVLLINENMAGVAWSGDSRVYRFRQDMLQRLTHDHTLAGRLVREQGLTAAQATRDPEANNLTQALGVPSFAAEHRAFGLVVSDWFVVCSDGLTRCVPEAAIAQVLQAHECTQACANALLERALNAGAPDNVSVIVVAAGARAP